MKFELNNHIARKYDTGKICVFCGREITQKRRSDTLFHYECHRRFKYFKTIRKKFDEIERRREKRKK